MTRQEEPGGSEAIGLLDWRKILPFETAVSSERLGWAGLQAAHCSVQPPFEINPPAIAYHRLIFFSRPPEELDLEYAGMKQHLPPPARSIMLVPAGSPVRVRSSGHRDELHVFLDAPLVARVAAETFDLDPARVTVPPLYGVNHPHLRAAMGAVDAELGAGGAGGALAAESLANVLTVHLIRHIFLTPRPPARSRDGAMPRARLRAAVDYIEGHLDTTPTLEQMATAARLSPYHFARQFKAATGLPPHQYVIARRVERAKALLQDRDNLSLAQVALRAGFSDQSQFSRHFLRIIGVTPGRFRTSAGVA